MTRSNAKETLVIDFTDDDFLKARQKLIELCVAKLGMPRKTAVQVSYLANRAFAELARSATGRRASPNVKKVMQEMEKRLAKGLSAEGRRHFVRDVIAWADKELRFTIRKTKVNELWDDLEPTRLKQQRKMRSPEAGEVSQGG